MLVTLSKFGLPIWFLTSFSLWIWLPTEALLALTPMVCALLLSAVGAVLIYTLHQLKIEVKSYLQQIILSTMQKLQI